MQLKLTRWTKAPPAQLFKTFFEIDAIASQIYHVWKACVVFHDSDAFDSASSSARQRYSTKNIDRQSGAIHPIFLDSIKQILWRVLICDPASICYSPPCSLEDSYGLYQFTYRTLQCRPDAAEARLRCRYSLNNPAWLMLIRGSRHFPPRFIQDGFLNHVAFSIRML